MKYVVSVMAIACVLSLSIGELDVIGIPAGKVSPAPEDSGSDELDVSLIQQKIHLAVHSDQDERSGSARSQMKTRTTRQDFGHPDWLSSCKSLYLDVGSNIGVQVRKLYEPGLYPGAAVLPLFDKHFGEPASRCGPGANSGLCALGFEPNPRHWPRLRALEQAYARKGWNVHFYPFAVGHDEGNLSFVMDNNPVDWSAHVEYYMPTVYASSENSTDVQVRGINFGAFLKTLPAPAKLMKMDIEGAEWEVLARMEQEGQFCQDTVGELFIEVHHQGDTEHWQRNQTFQAIEEAVSSQTCLVNTNMALLMLDDESYYLDNHTMVAFGEGSACGGA